MTTVNRPPLRRGLLLAGLCAAALLAPAGARADQIDEALLRARSKVVGKLEDAGYNNVGVLKFRVQRGSQPASFRAGELNNLMATRLENALILAEPAPSFGVTRGASQVAAAKDRKSTYLTEAGRRKLFAYAYPLAWGHEKVATDAFITGTVHVASDLRSAKVILEVFDKRDPEPRPLHEFQVKADKSLLRDLNCTFVVRKRGDNDTTVVVMPDPVDDKLPDEVKKEEKGEKKALVVEEVKGDGYGEKKAQYGPAAAEVRADLSRLLDFRIYYDDQLVEPVGGKVPYPKEGQRVWFKLKAAERLALVLRVNGVNTLDNQQAAVEDCSKWVLEPDEEYTIRGYYPNEKTVQLFRAEPPTPALLASFGKDVGVINLDVFRARKADGAARVASARALRLDLTGESLTELRGKLRSLKSRNVIVPGASEEASLESASFQGYHAGGWSVRYYLPEKMLDPVEEKDLP